MEPVATQPVDDAAQPPAGPFRDGDLLVMSSATDLPPRCVECNGSANGQNQQLELVWSPEGNPIRPGISSAIFLFSSQRAKVSLPVCQRHADRRKTLKRTILILTLLGPVIGGLFVVASQVLELSSKASENLFIAGMMVGCGLLFMPVMAYAFWFPFVEIKHMNGPFVWLDGAGESYLDSLPPLT